MGKKQPPPQVLEALGRGDEKAHRAMSKKGGAIRGQQLKEEADERAISDALEEARKKDILEDAARHAEENRIGWDDDYRP